MTNPDRSPVTSYLRRMVSLPAVGELTDADLLARFVAQRDEAAFEALVWRHGPKVLGVCRRVLRREQDAEDAFQAAFLVLVRKASSIGKRQAVGPWLYRVAYRVALRSKVRADRQEDRRIPLPDVPAADRTPELVWTDLRPVLDEEIDRLPAKYRTAFILCYLDGRTNEEAARELGCPKGTVLSRLAWARERLRARLTRRGLALSAGLLAAELSDNAVAAVAPALVDSTRKAAIAVASGQALGGVVSAAVAVLTKGALRTMLWTRILIATACVLVAGALGVGGAMIWQPAKASPQASGLQAPADKPDKAEPPASKEKKLEFEARAMPWTDVFQWYAKASGLPYVGQQKPAGAFTFIPPQAKQQYTLEEITDFINEALLAQKYILVRRAASFTVLPADEKVDPTLLPRIRLEELEKRGRTELVTVVVPLNVLKASEVAPGVKKMLGPFGDVVALEKGSMLILQDTAGNLRRIQKALKDIEARQPEKKPDPRAK